MRSLMYISIKIATFTKQKAYTMVKCPHCLSQNVIKNGYNATKKQNYRCKTCHKQFIDRILLKYKKNPKNYVSDDTIMRALRKR